jgi:hypothetical protein
MKGSDADAAFLVPPETEEDSIDEESCFVLVVVDSASREDSCSETSFAGFAVGLATGMVDPNPSTDKVSCFGFVGLVVAACAVFFVVDSALILLLFVLLVLILVLLDPNPMTLNGDDGSDDANVLPAGLLLGGGVMKAGFAVGGDDTAAVAVAVAVDTVDGLGVIAAGTFATGTGAGVTVARAGGGTLIAFGGAITVAGALLAVAVAVAVDAVAVAVSVLVVTLLAPPVDEPAGVRCRAMGGLTEAAVAVDSLVAAAATSTLVAVVSTATGVVSFLVAVTVVLPISVNALGACKKTASCLEVSPFSSSSYCCLCVRL